MKTKYVSHLKNHLVIIIIIVVTVSIHVIITIFSFIPVSSEASLAAIVLFQGLFKSMQSSMSDTCRQASLCQALVHLMLSHLPGSLACILISAFYQGLSRMEIFGQDNVTVNELVNPGNFHFRSFNVRNSSCVAHQEGWQVRDRCTQVFM